MSRPSAIIWFERLILAALAIDLATNLYFSGLIAGQWAAQGIVLSGPALIALCLASPALGLLLWYLIARRGSNIARWIMAFLVALATAGFVVAVVRAASAGVPSILIPTAISELLKIAAVVMVFTKDAGRWFSRAGRGDATR